jgi:hypothetical protein
MEKSYFTDEKINKYNLIPKLILASSYVIIFVNTWDFVNKLRSLERIVSY